MPYFGYFAQVRRGEIYLLITAIGRTHIEGFAVGEIKAFGKRYWKI
jgi:hypothetical protein